MAQDPSSSSSSDLPALSADRLEALRGRVDGLPAELRRCFLLRYERGFDEEEIGVLMKLPADGVRECLAEAWRRLGFGSAREVG
jgi:DNA-directed RNA polymerase specialized sigma24 family protein